MRRYLPAMLLAAFTLLSYASFAHAQGMTKEQYGQLVGKVEANAKTWVEQDTEDAATNAALTSLRYNDELLGELTTTLNVTRKDPMSVYVAAKLLYQLVPDQKEQQYLTPELARKILPTVKTVVGKQAKFLPYPMYGKLALKAFEIPANFTAKEVSPAVVAALDKIHQLRAEKLAKDKPVAQHNRFASDINRLYVRLLYVANDPKEDEEFFKQLTEFEAAGVAEFNYMLALLGGKVPEMPAERAKRFYEDLAKLAPGMKWKIGYYGDHTSPMLPPADNSRPYIAGFGTGLELYKLVNALADKGACAKMPGATEADINKAQAFIAEWRKKGPKRDNAFPSDPEIVKWLEEQKKAGK